MNLYRIYNENDEILAYACRDAGEIGDGYKLFQTGSCSLPAKKWEPTNVGDTFHHWKYGTVIIAKINRKTMKLTTKSGENVTVPL